VTAPSIVHGSAIVFQPNSERFAHVAGSCASGPRVLSPVTAGAIVRVGWFGADVAAP
jgi:hypothetical protein